MTMFRVDTEYPPVGMYIATLEWTEDTTHFEFDAGKKWVFEIQEGPYTGFTSAWITSTSPTLRNALGRLLAGLSGRPIRADEPIDSEEFFGQTYVIIVGDTSRGYSRIISVLPYTGTKGLAGSTGKDVARDECGVRDPEVSPN